MLGYEAAGRIGEAITPGFRRQGFHGCLVAIFAAAVAAARLLHLDPAQTAQAIALSATSIGGLAAAANTSVAREYHAGLAAMLGVNAALAAQRGYKAEEKIFETRHGFFEAYGGVDPATAAAAVTNGLGETWDIVTDMAVKLVPGGHPHHALAEAAANAARDGAIAAEEIETITLSRPGIDGARRTAASGRSDRHGAQPGLFPRRGCRRPRLLMGARDPGQDRRPGDPPADRQGAGRPGADRKCRALPARCDGDDPHDRRPHQHEHGLCAEGCRNARHRLGRHRR